MKRYREIVFSLTEPTDKEVIWIYPIKDVNNPKENDLIEEDALSSFDKNLYSVKIYNNVGWEDLYSGSLHYIKQQLLKEIEKLDIRLETLELFIGEIGENDTLEKRFELVTGDSEETIASLDTKIQTLQGDSQQTIATLDSALQALTETVAQNTLDIAGKQDAETGKDLSSNDFTDELLAQLTNLGHLAQYKGITTDITAVTNPSVGDFWIEHATSLDPYTGYIWDGTTWGSIGDCTSLVDVYTKTETNSQINTAINYFANNTLPNIYLPKVQEELSPGEFNASLWTFSLFDNTSHTYPYALDYLKRPSVAEDCFKLFLNPTANYGVEYNKKLVSLKLGGIWSDNNTSIDGGIELFNTQSNNFVVLKSSPLLKTLAEIPESSTTPFTYTVEVEEGFTDSDTISVIQNNEIVFTGVPSWDSYSNSYYTQVIVGSSNIGSIFFKPSNSKLSVTGSSSISNIIVAKGDGTKVFRLPSFNTAGDSNVLATTTKATTTRDGLLSKEDKAVIDNINTTIETQVTTQVSQAIQNIGETIPVGGIIMYSGNLSSLPDNWKICDGQNGTPNLSGRFVLGSGIYTAEGGSKNYTSGATGGKTEITLTSQQSGLPSHTHKFSRTYAAGRDLTGSGNHYYVEGNTINTETSTPYIGGTQYDNGRNALQPHENMPPYYVLAYIMRIS